MDMTERVLRFNANALVQQNNADELDALKGYSELIAFFEEAKGQTNNEELKKLFDEGIAIASEVSSDEKNHTELWYNFSNKLDGIKPAVD